MEQRAFGRTGLRLGALGFGCGNVGGLMVRGDPAERRRAVARALDAGASYFDTAPGYGDGASEEHLGAVLRELGAWDRVVVGTKVRIAADERADPAAAIRRSLEASLRRLGRDAVDVLYLHNPIGGAAADAALPADEASGAVLDGLAAVQRAGLARHIGCTALGAADALLDLLRGGRLEAVQAYVNALNPSAGWSGRSGGGQDFQGLIPAAAEVGLGVVAIRVLAAGVVAPGARHATAGEVGGPIAAGGGERADAERAERIRPLVAALDLDGPAELALRFALGVAGVSVALVGFSDEGQVEQAIRWAERGPLPAQALQRVVDLAG